MTLVALALPAYASADVRSGASDAGGRVKVTYDDAAGALTVVVSGPGSVLNAQLKGYCSEYPRQADSPPEQTAVDITASAAGAGAAGGEGVSTTTGSTVSADGFYATLSAPQLVDGEFRCLEGTLDGAPILLYFDGYRHEPLTSPAAKAAVLADLKAKYGGSISPKYLNCPQSRVTDTALCRYQLGRGGTVRIGTYIVSETEKSLAATRVRATTYSQKRTACPKKYRRDELIGTRVILDKRLSAPSVICGSTLPRIIIRKSVSAFPKRLSTLTINQTPAAGFEPLSRYKCKATTRGIGAGVGYRWSCANSLGDRVSFSFRVGRKTKSR